MNPRRTIFLLAALLLVAGGAVAALQPGGTIPKLISHAESPREAALEKAGIESSLEVARGNAALDTRIGAEGQHQLSRALRVKRALAAANRAAPIGGTGGTWAPYGSGPLITSPDYPAAHGDGFGAVNGRINDFALNPDTRAVYAAVAQGGLWRTTDMGKTWAAIGDNLPWASTGAVAYTKGGGGTLLVATGDMAFSNDYAGVGVFYSTDEGKSWNKSKGAPDGALSFRLRVDPTDPNTIYYASGMGLFRSTDAGRSFTNVDLPTGDCAGDSSKPNCFFANMVTDVVVQPKDSFGNKGGAVLAAVGWRAGRRPNFNNKPDAPANGLYRSETGAPGSFTVVPDSAGFTPQANTGRVSFGVADGEGQNGNYVYAVSQDSELFRHTVEGGEDDIPLVGTPSVLDAIYVSGDFGKTWTVMESRQEFFNTANQSSLSQLTPLGIGPGYQVTYNEFIKPDPLRQVNGVPTRVILGMEEVWQTATTQGVPQQGHSQFLTIGGYTANGGACLIVPEQCGAKQAIAGYTTTHPDQHAVLIVPDAPGDCGPTGCGETLFVGNDGGAYTQHVDATGEYNQLQWGNGANEGFYTLLPYGGAIAKDGTVFAGLQDNGELKITPDRKQYMTYVGDGTYALVDPDNSKVAYDELPNAGINVSTDGGATWTSIDPGLTDPDFVAPMVMDPTDAKHIVAVGRQIAEKTDGPASANWTFSYDLGTYQHPGDPGASSGDGDPGNHGTATQVIGDDMYVGFCGSCDPVKLKQKFHNGIATNVGGSKPGKRLTGDGWHIAARHGLPNRMITGVAMDPADHRTVYVTLGASAARYFAPIGAQGEDASDTAGGYVYKSTDAGENFHDITGDLPKVQATYAIVRGNQVIVSNAIGVFASSDKEGTRWAPLGSGLPPVSTYSMQLKPGDDDTLIAFTYGRGVQVYHFADPPPGAADCTTGLAPVVKVGKLKRSKRTSLRGTARATLCPRPAAVRKVQVAIQRKVGKRCRNVNRKGRFSKPTRCSKRVFLAARGKAKWSLTFKRRLPRGRYVVTVRATDAAGVRSKAKSRRVRTR